MLQKNLIINIYYIKEKLSYLKDIELNFYNGLELTNNVGRSVFGFSLHDYFNFFKNY